MAKRSNNRKPVPTKTATPPEPVEEIQIDEPIAEQADPPAVEEIEEPQPFTLPNSNVTHSVVDSNEFTAELPTLTFAFPVVSPENSIGSRRRLDIRFTRPAEARKLHQYLTAIIQSDVKLNNGRAVQTSTDAAKYIFEQLISKLPDPVEA